MDNDGQERQYIQDVCYMQLRSRGSLTRISDGMTVELSATEYKILHFLLANDGKNVSLEQIAGHIWKRPDEKEPESLKSQISRIRRKLDQIEPGLGRACISTNRGFSTYAIRLHPNHPNPPTEPAVPGSKPSPGETVREQDERPIVKPDNAAQVPFVGDDFRIVGGVIFISSGDDGADEQSEDDCDEWLLDREIDRRLMNGTPNAQSPLEKQIMLQKGRDFVSRLYPGLLAASARFDPVDVELDIKRLGKQFSISTVPGVTHMFYEVYSVYDHATQTRSLSARPLDHIPSEDGSQTTFFWDTANSDYILVLLSFQKDESGSYSAYINNAILVDGQLQVLKQPALFRFNSWYLPPSVHLDGVAYDVDHLSDEVKQRLLQEQLPREAEWVNTNIHTAPAIIIDPDTQMPLLRTVRYDETEQKLTAEVKMVPYKGYFVFRILSEQRDHDGSLFTPLTDRELGWLYRTGSHGFPRDILLAIRHLEQDGSPNSLYQIAGIFSTEEGYQNQVLYLEYLQKAADMGAESAIAELAAYTCQKGGDTAIRQAQALFRRAAWSDSTVGSFLYAACLEQGRLGETDDADVFDAYFRAARNSFPPALARLRCVYGDLEHPELLYDAYRRFREDARSLLAYCLGAACFYGYGLYQRKQVGIGLMQDAATQGCRQAAHTLYEIYANDPDYQDEQKAAYWQTQCGQLTP